MQFVIFFSWSTKKLPVTYVAPSLLKPENLQVGNSALGGPWPRRLTTKFRKKTIKNATGCVLMKCHSSLLCIPCFWFQLVTSLYFHIIILFHVLQLIFKTKAKNKETTGVNDKIRQFIYHLPNLQTEKDSSQLHHQFELAKICTKRISG